jgi:hypothetical protein
MQAAGKSWRKRRAEPSPIRKKSGSSTASTNQVAATSHMGIALCSPGPGVWAKAASGRRVPAPSTRSHASRRDRADYRARRRLLLSTDRGLGAAATARARSGRTYHEVAVGHLCAGAGAKWWPCTLSTASRALGLRATRLARI